MAVAMIDWRVIGISTGVTSAPASRRALANRSMLAAASGTTGKSPMVTASATFSPAHDPKVVGSGGAAGIETWSTGSGPAMTFWKRAQSVTVRAIGPS